MTWLLAVAAVDVWAGGRIPYGREIRVAAVGGNDIIDPLQVDTPVDASVLMLSRTPLCQISQLNIKEMPSRSSTSKAIIQLHLGDRVSPNDVEATFNRVRTSHSPYRALLSGVVSWRVGDHHLEIEIDPSWTIEDLDSSLCHPALSVLPGPFLRGDQPRFQANVEHPQGRPFLDAVQLSFLTARHADKRFRNKKIDVVYGAGDRNNAPRLFATVLVYGSELGQRFRNAVEKTVDRQFLARFLGADIAAPMFGLLPADLGGALSETDRPPPSASLPGPGHSVTLFFEASRSDDRFIAERLQIKLRPQGYRVVLRSVTHAEVNDLNIGPFDVLLRHLALPPSPKVALAVLAAAVSGERGTREPPNVIPLVATALTVTLDAKIKQVEIDRMGIARLENAYWEIDRP